MEIRIEPARAVPIDAPRFVIVFWTPPTSELCSSGTAETVTAPSCEASAPMPEPDQEQRHEDDLRRRSRRRAERAARRFPRSSASRPPRTTSRGDDLGKSRGTPIAATSSVIESGRMRTPVSIADRPSADREVERHDEEDPGLNEVLEEEHRQAAGELPVPEQLPADERLSAACVDAVLPAEEEPEHEQAAENQPDRPARNRPSSGRRRAAGASPTRPTGGCRRRTAPSPSAESTAPTRSSFGFSVTGASAIRRPSTRIASTTTTSPAKTQRQEKYVVAKPPISGPTATAIAPAAATSPYAAGRRSAGKFARDERDDRGQDQRRADALEERPAEQQDRQVRRERGRQRAAAVDHAADREGALAPDQRADLRAGDHQRTPSRACRR